MSETKASVGVQGMSADGVATAAHAGYEKAGCIIEETARVLSRDLLAEGLTRLILRAPGIAARAKAGQFVHVLVPDGAHVLRRPISLMAFDPAAGTLTLAIAQKGRGTQILCAVDPGDSLQMLGPLGNGFDARGAKCVYFVGGGVGIAPICCAMDAVATEETARTAGTEATSDTGKTAPDAESATSAETASEVKRAFFGFRSAACAYGMTQSPYPVTAVSDDGTLGEKALVTVPLERAIDERRPDLIMACGPLPMMRAVKRLALERDIPCQLSLEERMGCGIGACVGCNVKCPTEDGGFVYRRVCRDGPVFDAKEVLIDG